MMPPFLLPILAFVRANIGWLKYVAGGVAVLLALWWSLSAIYDAGVAAERHRWEARQRAAAAKAAADTKLLADAMSEIDTGITLDMEAVANVRTIYRDKVVYTAVDVFRDRPDCVLPGGLLGQINATASGYAAAATGAGNAAVPAAKPTP